MTSIDIETESVPLKELLLYNHPLSSYAQKVRMYLREKGVPFKAIAPNGLTSGEHDTTFQVANPRLEVPTLVVPDEDLAIFDSTIIIEYLEDRYPSPALMSVDPAARARARMIEEVCDTHYEAVNWGIGEIKFFDRAEGEMAEKLLGEGEQQTRVLLEWLTTRLGNGEFFSGKHFGSADICVAPLVNRSKFFGFGPSSDSPLGLWLERISQRESVKATFAEFEGAAAKMREYAPIFKSGQRKRQYRDHRLDWLIKSGGIDIVLDGLKANNIRFSWPDPQS